MLASEFFIHTFKETPAHAELKSHQLMLRSGMIRRLASGLYTWMPLGLRVLDKVRRIVQETMNEIGAQEMLMPMVQPKELWEETNRWGQFGSELLQLKDRHERDFCLGPTHEEVITDIARHVLNSYKQLPCTFYQIQTKFRDEIRPRFGVMRAREFMMKDAYSFHADTESLQTTYETFYEAYCSIFEKLGLDYRAVEADTGSIGGSTSHEFHVIADAGEDVLVYSEDGSYAANTELTDGKVPEGMLQARGIEVGHIFQLGTKYSEAMGATVVDDQGKQTPLVMGCYGIGVSRIVAAAIEQHHHDNGIHWPAAMAPFDVHIIPMNYHKSEAIQAACQQLYEHAKQEGKDVLLDDRQERAGALFADADLIGAPVRWIVGERSLKEGNIEVLHPKTGEKTTYPLKDLL